MSFSSRLGGALSGGASGALGGSAFGPVGTAVGGGLGALGGALGLLDKPENLQEFDRFTPEQQALVSQLLGALTGQGGPQGGVLGDLLNSDALENRAMRQFQEQTIPGLAERFAGLGAQSSSAFQQALGQSGADLSERLAALNLQSKQGLLGPLLNMVMQPQKDRYFQPGGASGLAQGLGGLAGGIGGGIGQGLGAQLAQKWGNAPLGNTGVSP